MAFYTERPAIPLTIVHQTQAAGLGPEIGEEREGKTGIIREVDCNIMFDINTAKNIRTWLDQQIRILEALGVNSTPPEKPDEPDDHKVKQTKKKKN